MHDSVQVVAHKYWLVECTGRNVEIEHRLAHGRLESREESSMGVQDSLKTTKFYVSTSEEEFVGSMANVSKLLFGFHSDAALLIIAFKEVISSLVSLGRVKALPLMVFVNEYKSMPPGTLSLTVMILSSFPPFRLRQASS
ncbi:hypothetical protein E6O75_ATG06502 [Venturia nashicola]|uniref:Uncharacterized protein n=1 Tax=Venturia nashicola TaxID=86259 RepID=A0A4Z1PAD2_9PEZI|nr:hypothetical protein E6O75_ATG06502 [Venturia nashicola]